MWTAGDVVDSGYCGDYTTWTLYSDGKLVISGKGAIYNATPAWDSYNIQIKSVVIEDGVTNIPNEAFYYYYKNLTSVTFNGETPISKKMFMSAESISLVVIKGYDVEIANGAFNGFDDVNSQICCLFNGFVQVPPY